MLRSLLRTLIMYGAILIGVRVMGKRQISQLQTSELVVTLLISELAVNPIERLDRPLWDGLLPMLVLVLCELVVSLLMLKSGKFRQLVCGKPMVVIEDGKIRQKQMKRLRLSTEDLLEELRQSGVFYLEEVAHAVMETNGKLSVIKHAADDSLTPRQAKVKVKDQGLEVVVVSDGEISRHSLALCGKDETWVRKQAEKAGLPLSRIFLMTARTDGGCRVVPREKGEK